MTRLHDDDNTRDAEMHRSSFSTTAVEPFGAGVKSTSDVMHDGSVLPRLAGLTCPCLRAGEIFSNSADFHLVESWSVRPSLAYFDFGVKHPTLEYKSKQTFMLWPISSKRYCSNTL